MRGMELAQVQQLVGGQDLMDVAPMASMEPEDYGWADVTQGGSNRSGAGNNPYGGSGAAEADFTRPSSPMTRFLSPR